MSKLHRTTSICPQQQLVDTIMAQETTTQYIAQAE